MLEMRKWFNMPEYRTAMFSALILPANLGNNDVAPPGWVFSGTAYTWTGTTDTAWDGVTTTNWSPNGIPDVGDSVVIPDVTNDPVLSNAVSVTDLTILSGGLLDLNTSDLTVSGDLTNVGTIRLDGGENITGTLNTDSGTVEYDGVGTTVNILSFYDLVVSGTQTLGGIVNVGNDLSITGSLDAATFALTVGGDLTGAGNFTASNALTTIDGIWNMSGTFTHGGGTVSLSNYTSLVEDDPFNDLNITSSGAMILPAVTAAGTITTNSGGALTQTGVMSANLLSVTSTRGVNLNQTNTISNLTITNTVSGNIDVTNSGALTITGSNISQVTGSSVNIQNTGIIMLTGNIAAGTGSITLDTLSGSVISGTGNLTADILNLQTDPSSSGFIGSSGFANHIKTNSSGAGVLATLTLGGGNLLSTYIDHQTGDLTIGSLNCNFSDYSNQSFSR